MDDLSLVLRAWLSPKMWRKDVQVICVTFCLTVVVVDCEFDYSYILSMLLLQ